MLSSDDAGSADGRIGSPDAPELVERILQFARARLVDAEAGRCDAAFDRLALDCLRAQGENVAELGGAWRDRDSAERWVELQPWPEVRLTSKGPCWGSVEEEFHAQPPTVERPAGSPAAGSGEPSGSPVDDVEPAVVRCQPLLDLQRDLMDLQVRASGLLEAGGGTRPPVLILSPPRMVAPHDESAFVAEHLVERWSGEGTRYAAGAGGLHSVKARQWLREQADGSAWLLGSRVAVHDLCVELERHGEELAPGGLAGIVAIERAALNGPIEEELTRRVRERLGAEPGLVHLLWNHPALSSLAVRNAGEPAGELNCPPWLAVAVVDSDGGVSVEAGGAGRLAFLDLANLGSACWVATDLPGRLLGDGRFVVGQSEDHGPSVH